MEDHLLTSFGTHLKSLRLERSFSQEQLALKADMDRTYVSGIERGQRNVSLINLFKLASALDIPAKQLLDFTVEGSL
ncbi:helix-turn-helix domain-containing protein [Shewanella sp. NKUCC05_KAH]|jgi:transcriptional regulator with XRE-family HTH domain|uniref:helix-turn-helix domain-containing protein n=1 Tax=Shewanella TaxID=22 RepID=UPI000956A7D5|nr:MULTISPECIES: helix-turn-helix transcriptional regulator [Shewanella]RBP76688.1 Xre family transcriptional regulator [Shewanella putrefaciens]MBW3528934.1 helix-turn-helix domain-containing protein [Shewanella sp. NKUCC05_KAH]MBW3531796.1 helix-turn-helix domain-containing protein [Shewanella sp. NKUCC06_TVS]MCS6101584.1 helix-turn-helix transcriptional regulator [Shewanella baltica]MCS6129324.1 helix-turn-helix transcriptional regulator [Shewanella baltica]